MRLTAGVEWALHSCVVLDWARQEAVPAVQLAEFYQLPPVYLNKQLQALARAGIVASLPGRRGGFRLARPPEQITLMDVVTAIEGPEEAFRCTEIRRQGSAVPPGTRFRAPCSIATAMRRAELAWRRALAEQTLADVIRDAERADAQARDRTRRWFESARA